MENADIDIQDRSKFRIGKALCFPRDTMLALQKDVAIDLYGHRTGRGAPRPSTSSSGLYLTSPPRPSTSTHGINRFPPLDLRGQSKLANLLELEPIPHRRKLAELLDQEIENISANTGGCRVSNGALKSRPPLPPSSMAPAAGAGHTHRARKPRRLDGSTPSVASTPNSSTPSSPASSNPPSRSPTPPRTPPVAGRRSPRGLYSFDTKETAALASRALRKREVRRLHAIFLDEQQQQQEEPTGALSGGGHRSAPASFEGVLQVYYPSADKEAVEEMVRWVTKPPKLAPRAAFNAAFPPPEQRELVSRFGWFDLQRSDRGFVEISQLTAALVERGGLDAEYACTLLRAADANGDGVLSLEELAALVDGADTSLIHALGALILREASTCGV